MMEFAKPISRTRTLDVKQYVFFGLKNPPWIFDHPKSRSNWAKSVSVQYCGSGSDLLFIA